MQSIFFSVITFLNSGTNKWTGERRMLKKSRLDRGHKSHRLVTVSYAKTMFSFPKKSKHFELPYN